MDLLNILIDPNKAKNICCLCYKNSENTTSLHEDLEIHDEYFILKLPLENIMNNLFPSHDFLLSQTCEDCITLIIKIFSLLQRHCMKTVMLSYIIDNLDEEIEDLEFKLVCGNKPKKCRLKLNIPKPDHIMEYRKSMENIECGKCLMKFKSRILLKQHIQISHKTTNNAIVCDVCGKIFPKSSMLKAHLSCHTKKQCPYCFKFLKSHSHYNVHVKNHRTPSKIKRKAKYYKCSNCDYRSINKSTLEAHINKYHLHIRPFICEICNKGFYKKDNLTQHLATHNKTKDKTCDICGDTFTIEKTLREHLRLHNGQKPFKCDICNIGFITSGRRYEHMKRKHSDKNECCIICDKKFSLKKDLNTHLKKVHGAETKNVLLKLDDQQSEYEVVKVINYKK